MINENGIENVVQTPDTVITMANGHNYIVQDSLEEIMRRIVAFNRASHARSGREGPRES